MKKKQEPGNYPSRICFFLIWSKRTSPNSISSPPQRSPTLQFNTTSAKRSRLSRCANHKCSTRRSVASFCSRLRVGGADVPTWGATGAATHRLLCAIHCAKAEVRIQSTEESRAQKDIISSTMKAAQISKPGGDFELVERDMPEPGAAQVRVKVEACGICHSDVLVKEGLWPGLQYPRVPGHEIAGRIDSIGPDVTLWKTGQRVGVGWHGGHCFECEPCRRGDFINCKFQKVTGIHYD